MSILSTNKKLIKVGAEYSAGSGISIDNYVISVTSTLTGDYASQSAFDELSDSFSSLSSNINSNSGVWDDVVNKLYISSYHELSAGANINITDYVVSSRDWTNEIAQASANAVNEASALIPTLTFHYLEI